MKIETTRANFKVYFLDLRLPSIPSNLCKTIQLVCKEQTLIYSLRELGRQAYTIVEVVPENFNFILVDKEYYNRYYLLVGGKYITTF